MYNPVTIPFGSKMLFNAVKLRPGVSAGDIELALGQMCSDTFELGFDMLWQGLPEHRSPAFNAVQPCC